MARIDITRENEQEYGVPGDDTGREQFYAKLPGQGQASGKPGWNWMHTGSGWAVTDDAAAGTPGGGGAQPPAPPAPGQGPTTPPGEPQRPSAMPPSPPPANTPAPQIPLGTPGQQVAPGQRIAPMEPNGTPGRITGPGLLDASQPAGTQAAPDPIDAAYRAALLEMLQQNPNEASVTDADIAPQSRAFSAAQYRAAAKNRAGLAAQANAEGTLDSGAMRSAGQAINERAEQTIGANDAALIGQKLQTRREQVAMAAQMAQQRGMQQEANDLQRQLANLDAELKTRGIDVTREGYQLQRDLASLDANTKQYLADLDGRLREEGYSTQERLAQLDAEVRRLGINTQGNIGELEIALRRELGIGELNLGYLQTLLADRQSSNRLGFDIGQWQSVLNKDALLAALGG